ncbi:hypothetical protein [Streptomyces hesseae]|uniref:Uncharacterized protein n=1 Tax=Streptomyces hesseae TaxID=3075519 RepID=A0ABU2SKE0_9ACTN|nr:hypothetical protein [Streptomyces sp. DSM 40473]MDT0449447.1 hypothetical protein [Streptomyces sp. DSM 40473]
MSTDIYGCIKVRHPGADEDWYEWGHGSAPWTYTRCTSGRVTRRSPAFSASATTREGCVQSVGSGHVDVHVRGLILRGSALPTYGKKQFIRLLVYDCRSRERPGEPGGDIFAGHAELGRVTAVEPAPVVGLATRTRRTGFAGLLRALDRATGRCNLDAFSGAPGR